MDGLSSEVHCVNRIALIFEKQSEVLGDLPLPGLDEFLAQARNERIDPSDLPESFLKASQSLW
jgi:hypothetical protein